MATPTWLKRLGEAREAAPGDVMLIEGEGRREGCVEGAARTAGEPPREGRPRFTESEPDWESLLLLGEPEIARLAGESQPNLQFGFFAKAAPATIDPKQTFSVETNGKRLKLVETRF